MHEQGKASLKNQLKKKVQTMCDDMGTAAAAEKAAELAEEMSEEYDKKVASGMTELDAYKELLRDMDKIEEMLRALPETDEEADTKEEIKSRSDWNKKLSAIQDKVNGLWWLLTVIFYFWFSFTFGKWHLTWLIFLSSAIGSIVIDMLFSYNKGVPKKKVFGKLHGILWLAIIIAYFLISLTVGKWHLTWIIFVMGAVIESITGLVEKIFD